MAREKGILDYPLETRREAIRLFYEEGLTRAQITQQLGIRDPGRVKHWLNRYRKEGEAFFLGQRHRSGRRPQRENVEAYLVRLEMENALTGEQDVCVLRHFASELLCLAAALPAARSGYAPDGIGRGGLSSLA